MRVCSWRPSATAHGATYGAKHELATYRAAVFALRHELSLRALGAEHERLRSVLGMLAPMEATLATSLLVGLAATLGAAQYRRRARFSDRDSQPSRSWRLDALPMRAMSHEG